MKGFFKKAAALLMAGLMAGSGSYKHFAEEAEDAAPEKKWRLNVACARTSHIPVVCSYRNGQRMLLRKEDIEIKLWSCRWYSEIAAMEGGSIDLAYIGHGAHKHQGTKLRSPSSVQHRPCDRSSFLRCNFYR